jgi:hypothetical protein
VQKWQKIGNRRTDDGQTDRATISIEHIFSKRAQKKLIETPPFERFSKTLFHESLLLLVEEIFEKSQFF